MSKGKEYFYVVKWSEGQGWEIDPDTEAANFPDGTVYDTETGEWQLAYLGDGEYNGHELELTESLTGILNAHNIAEGGSDE